MPAPEPQASAAAPFACLLALGSQRAAADAEGDSAVERGVSDRGHQQGKQVGHLRRHRVPHHEVQQDVGEGAQRAAAAWLLILDGHDDLDPRMN